MKSKVFLIKSDILGTGDDHLGRILHVHIFKTPGRG